MGPRTCQRGTALRAFLLHNFNKSPAARARHVHYSLPLGELDPTYVG